MSINEPRQARLRGCFLFFNFFWLKTASKEIVFPFSQLRKICRWSFTAFSLPTVT